MHHSAAARWPRAHRPPERGGPRVRQRPGRAVRKRVLAACLWLLAPQLNGCCADPEAAAWSSYPPEPIGDRFEGTRLFLESRVKVPAVNVYDHAMRAAQETLDRTGRRAIAGIAATAYAARVRDGYVLMGTWFEHIPTVTEIEVWRRGPTGDDKLWADSISQTDMASNYSLLSGFGGGHPVAVYQWTVSIAADQSPDAFHGLESLPADTHLFVRLIRARPEYYPFEADLVMTGDRPQVSDDGAPKRHRNDTFDDEQP